MKNYDIPRIPESYRTLTSRRIGQAINKNSLIAKDRTITFNDLYKWYPKTYDYEIFGRTLPLSVRKVVEGWWSSNVISRFQTMKANNIELDIDNEIQRFVITIFNGNYKAYLRQNINFLSEIIVYWLLAWNAPILDDEHFLPLRKKWLFEMKKYEEAVANDSKNIVIPYPDFYPFVIPENNGQAMFEGHTEIAEEYFKYNEELAQNFEKEYDLENYIKVQKDRYDAYAKSEANGRFYDEFVMKIPPTANITDFGDIDERKRRMAELT